MSSTKPYSLEKIFYVYVYLNPFKEGKFTYKDSITFFYEPFYIGKGKDERIVEHLQPNVLKNCVNKHFANTILKIKREGSKPIILKMLKDLNEGDAFFEEKRLVRNIGRRVSKDNFGPLTNLSEAGEGNTGYKHTEIQRQRNRETHLGIPRIFTDEHKVNLSVSKIEHFQDPKNREITSISTKKGMDKPEVRAKMKGPKTNECKRKLSEKAKLRIGSKSSHHIKITIDGVTYSTLKEASEKLEISVYKIHKYYLDKEK
jgi:hypothetical protein